MTPPPTNTFQDSLQAFEDMSIPALRLLRSSKPSSSHLGGVPELPETFQWPVFEETPLAFLACLDLAHLPDHSGLEWLPRLGRLLFFYDTTRNPWGFDPQEKMQWRVMLAPAPLATDIPVHPSHMRPYARQDVEFQETISCPSPMRDCMKSLDLSPEDHKKLSNHYRAACGSDPLHQVGGYPVPISEDDMEVARIFA